MVGTVTAAARRFGYLVAAAITAAIWWAVNVWPGWEQVSFLTSRTADVLTWINVSLIASVVANLVYASYDSRWFKAFGDLVTTTISLVATARVWQVFPFDFSRYSFNWTTLVRVALGVAIVGSVIAIAVQIGTLIRLTVHGSGAPPHKVEVGR